MSWDSSNLWIRRDTLQRCGVSIQPKQRDELVKTTRFSGVEFQLQPNPAELRFRHQATKAGGVSPITETDFVG